MLYIIAHSKYIALFQRTTSLSGKCISLYNRKQIHSVHQRHSSSHQYPFRALHWVTGTQIYYKVTAICMCLPYIFCPNMTAYIRYQVQGTPQTSGRAGGVVITGLNPAYI